MVLDFLSELFSCLRRLLGRKVIFDYLKNGYVCVETHGMTELLDFFHRKEVLSFMWFCFVNSVSN